MKRIHRLVALVGIGVCVSIAGLDVHAQPATPACDFSAPSLVQAQCLLRPGLAAGEALPAVIVDLLGRQVNDSVPVSTGLPIDVSEAALRASLAKRRIALPDIGGELELGLSVNAAGEPARYFVIHDTSYPVYSSRQSFPRHIDDPHWNRELARRLVVQDRKRDYGAHLYIDRHGQVRASFPFDVARLSTKTERLQPELVGLFIAVECLQPHGRDARGLDTRTPSPAFTRAQLDTLALAYVVASYRARRWLIPALHAGVDAGYAGAHDDPRGFSLALWSGRLALLLRSLQLSGKTPV